jgi:hypothetical protein
MRADGDPPQDSAQADAAPGLDEAVRALGEEGKAGLKAARDAAKALRILISADVSLARSAFGRTLAFTGAAIAFGASAWLLLMAALVTWMSLGAGLAWGLSLLLTGTLSVAAAAGAGYTAIRYFEHTRMQATRRQLARLGIGELSDMLPKAGSAESSEAAAERVSEATEEAPVKKGLGIDVTPP